MQEMSVPVMRPVLPEVATVLPRLASVQKSGTYSNFGPQERELRSRFAERYAVAPDRVVTASSATSALTGAMTTSDAPSWTVPAFTFTATVAAALQTGRPVRMGDIRADDWWLDERTQGHGLVPVAPFGAGLDQVPAIPSDRTVVIDAAASSGWTGSLAWLPERWCVVLSLHATKVLGAGEGAIAILGSSDWADEVRSWTNFGFAGTRTSERVGTNAKMSEVQAAYANAALDGWGRERSEWTAARDAVLRVGDELGFSTHAASRDGITPYWILVLPDARSTDVTEKVLTDRGIGTRRWWGRGCHRMSAYSAIEHAGLEVTDEVAGRYIGLPMFRGLSVQDLERIRVGLEAVRRVLAAG